MIVQSVLASNIYIFNNKLRDERFGKPSNVDGSLCCQVHLLEATLNMSLTMNGICLNIIYLFYKVLQLLSFNCHDCRNLVWPWILCNVKLSAVCLCTSFFVGWLFFVQLLEENEKEKCCSNNHATLRITSMIFLSLPEALLELQLIVLTATKYQNVWSLCGIGEDPAVLGSSQEAFNSITWSEDDTNK